MIGHGPDAIVFVVILFAVAIVILGIDTFRGPE